ncbi:UNVERIFIED_ORG: hypothetical protein M2414_000030 [Rahnella aquatilis]
MAKITSKDLRFTYSKKAVTGDNPKLKAEDRQRFSDAEEYEVVDFINSFHGAEGKELPLISLQKIEWLLHEKKPGSTQGSQNVRTWVIDNFNAFNEEYEKYLSNL